MSAEHDIEIYEYLWAMRYFKKARERGDSGKIIFNFRDGEAKRDDVKVELSGKRYLETFFSEKNTV